MLPEGVVEPRVSLVRSVFTLAVGKGDEMVAVGRGKRSVPPVPPEGHDAVDHAVGREVVFWGVNQHRGPNSHSKAIRVDGGGRRKRPVKHPRLVVRVVHLASDPGVDLG
jgi:hypothetical protein